MSFIHRFIGTENNYRWEDVPVREYGEEFLGVTRQVMIGPDDGSNNFHLRYFRLEPGSHSHLEHHPHEHGVIILHGKARVQLNDEFFEVKPYDAIFNSSEDVHQFTPVGDEPLGFLCVIKDKNSK